MDSYSQSPSSGAPPRKKLKIGNGNACELCRSKKIKCDGTRPACGNCHKKQHVCVYHVNTTTVTQEQATKIPGIGYSGSPGTFAGEVKAAIDARFGAIPGGLSNAMPMADAPLFELQLPRRRPSDERLENVLPPRRQADELLNAFWRYINPVDCFLDKKRFSRSYEALFAGGDLGMDEHTFICTLNVVFAFASQSHESKEASERDVVANTYFLRAWNSLSPETILWEPPSLQVVECLLLMSRYLQCTNNSHQTWMAVGLAIRIAQSLRIHLPKTSDSGVSDDQAHWQHHLWNCCVYADMYVHSMAFRDWSKLALTLTRTISWMLGHTSITSLEALPSSTRRKYSYDNYLPETIELYEISCHFVKAQTSTGGNVAEKFGLFGYNQRKESYCSIVLQHESCLVQWEKARLGTMPLEESESNDLKLRRHILQLRLLHARILLFRPMLARCCFLQQSSCAVSDPHYDTSYKGHMIRHGALQCVEAAQKMISLVDKDSERSPKVPWWYRIFHLHMAGTILLAAMQSVDLFTPAVSESWQQTLSVIKRHEHLCLYVPQFAYLFQSLSRKIRQPGQSDSPEELSDAQFHDMFEEFGLHNDGFLFDDVNETWLNGVPGN